MFSFLTTYISYIGKLCESSSMTKVSWSEDIVLVRIEENDITWSNVFMHNWMSILLLMSYKEKHLQM